MNELRPWFVVGEDSVQLLRDGAEAFPEMLESIRRARREVLLEMYWIGADSCGGRFRNALVDAARRGVTVKVIYDAVGSLDLGPTWWAPLTDERAEVHAFHPFAPFKRGFRWRLLEERDHRKLLVVDGELAFTGGINLADAWLPLTEGGRGWRDDVIAVQGPTAAELRTLFFRTRRRISGRKSPADLRPIPRRPTRPVRVLTTRALPRRRIHREYILRIRQAVERVDIANPYFIPDRAVSRALVDAVRRGVKVRVLVPARGDVPFAHLAMHALFDRLLRRGVDLYAMPGPMMHAKTAIIDDVFATIGSYNLDERSWRKNLEVNIAVEDAPFARHVRHWFEHDLEAAGRVDLTTWRERPRAWRAMERLALAARKLW